MPIASPAVFERIGTLFRQAVTRYAEHNDIPVIKFTREMRKIEEMSPLLEDAARQSRSRVAAIGVAQEFRHVWEARKRGNVPYVVPQFTFAITERWVTCYYFYIGDGSFGPGFIKACAYFPYPAKVWINRREWAKRQMTRLGVGFTELSNGFASYADPAALQAACDRLGPGQAGHGVLRTVDVADPAPAGTGGPGCGLVVGAIDAPG
jgi:hypothetical protein